MPGVNLAVYDKDDGQTGIASVNPAVAGGGATMSSVARGARIRPSRNMTIASIAFSVSVAATTDDACRVGITDAAGTVVASSASTSGQLNSQGAKNVSLSAPYALTAGTTYYLFLWAPATGGTAASIAAGAAAHSSGLELYGTTMGVVLNFIYSTGTFPTSIVRGSTSVTPVLIARES